MKKQVLKIFVVCLIYTLVWSLLVSCDTGGEGETESATETIVQTEEKTEGKTETPAETETETEKIDIAKVEIPKLLEGALDFSFGFLELLYTTSTENFCYSIQSNTPGGYLCRGDQWALYRIDGGKVTLIGEIMHEIAIEYEAPSEDEYIISHEHLTFKSLCGKPTLDPGDYCLVYLIQAPDENGYYHTYAGAKTYIYVVEE